MYNFYPRPPRGGRPEQEVITDYAVSISIHALREEGDLEDHRMRTRRADFYPRPPRGGRPTATVTRVPDLEFLSTPSARRATEQSEQVRGQGVISIHALREEGDGGNPESGQHQPISIHALREEGDYSMAPVFRASCISIHALREEGDRPSP